MNKDNKKSCCSTNRNEVKNILVSKEKDSNWNSILEQPTKPNGQMILIPGGTTHSFIHLNEEKW
jgi:hypothetical protein